MSRRLAWTQFEVLGLPAAQGSKTVGRAASGRAFVRESSAAVKPFRQAVAVAAREAGVRLVDGAWALQVRVEAVRPASHLTARGALRKGAPTHPGGHDASKVLRAVEDALAGIAWRNDRQVRAESIVFAWGGMNRVLIRVAPAPRMDTTDTRTRVDRIMAWLD